MTGQDLSEVFLHEAQAQAVTQQVQLRWVQSDMRTILFAKEFDAVINIFTAFGYLEHEAEDQKVLQQVYQALKPSGLFLMELVKRDGLMRHSAPHAISHAPDGLMTLEERTFDLLPAATRW